MSLTSSFGNSIQHFRRVYAVVGVQTKTAIDFGSSHQQHELKTSAIFVVMPEIITEYPQFFTATNLEWKKLLKPDKYKDIVINSLKFLVDNKRVRVFCFIIMDNHIHLIWQMLPGTKPANVQRDFLKYTAQSIQNDLAKYHPLVLNEFVVNAKDRKYQFWERNALSIELRQRKVFMQKVEYIHANATRAGICKFPEEYRYSSALFYESGIDNFGFLTHYNE